MHGELILQDLAIIMIVAGLVTVIFHRLRQPVVLGYILAGASVGATAVIAATLEIVVMVLIGYQIGRMFGWSSMDSLFLGAILSISSTTIIVKALGDLGRVKERF